MLEAALSPAGINTVRVGANRPFGHAFAKKIIEYLLDLTQPRLTGPCQPHLKIPIVFQEDPQVAVLLRSAIIELFLGKARVALLGSLHRT